jgi:hypothetical protein
MPVADNLAQERDRGVQAAALKRAGLAAPRTLRTTSLAKAVGWAEACRLPGYVVAPADTAVSGPARVVHAPLDISFVWRDLRRVVHHQAADPHLVIQEHLPGPHYLVHSVSRPGADGTPQHTITSIWSETRTSSNVADRANLVPATGLLPRALAVYLFPALDCLGVTAGTVRSRIVYAPGRGPVLLSARPRPATADTPLRGVVRGVVGDYRRPRPRTERRLHVSRVRLIARADGVVDAPALRALASLPTVAQVDGPLWPGARVERTVDRRTSPGEVVLIGERRALEADYHAIRAMEVRGLYQGNAR